MNSKYFIFPQFNPTIFSIGYITFYWYGLMYVLGFLFTMLLGLKRINKLNNLTKNDFKNLIYNIFFGIVIGGRIGYICFYNIKYFFRYPFYIFEIWKGGMSFHGGFIAVIVIVFYFSQKEKKSFFQISDFISPLVPFGIGLGRLGNFINCELWGKISTNTPWSVIFPNSYLEDEITSKKHDNLQLILYKYGFFPRHPSQIYEFLLEGVILFIMLNFVLKNKKIGFITGIFIMLYGIFRNFIEFFRQPDIQLGLIANVFSMGQILSIPMILGGFIIIILSNYNYIK